MQALWSYIERHANANQFLFSPNASTYDAGSYPRGERRLLFIPTLTFASSSSLVAQHSGGSAPLVRDGNAPFPYIPCIYQPSTVATRGGNSNTSNELVIVHFHGTGGDAHKSGQLWFGAVERMPIADRCSVLSVEYPGYGIFPGEPSEELCQATATYVLRYLIVHCGVHPSQIVLSGRSMGSGVATFAASQLHEVGVERSPACAVSTEPFAFGGLVLISPFTSIHGVLRHFPVAGSLLVHLVRDRFPNQARVRQIPSSTPLFLFHGARDTLIPSASSHAIRDAACQGSHSSRLCDILIDPDADHHRVPLVDEWLREVIAKVTSYHRAEQPSTNTLSLWAAPSAIHAALLAAEAPPASTMRTMVEHETLLHRRYRMLQYALIVVIAGIQNLRLSNRRLLLISCVWSVLVLLIAPLRWHRKNVLKPLRIVTELKPRAAVLSLLCRVILPALCLVHGGLGEAAVGVIVSHVLLS